MALALVLAGAAQGHVLVEGTVVPYLRGLPYHHAHAVVDKEPPAYLCPRVYLYAGPPARALGYGPGYELHAVALEP